MVGLVFALQDAVHASCRQTVKKGSDKLWNPPGFSSWTVIYIYLFIIVYYKIYINIIKSHVATNGTNQYFAGNNFHLNAYKTKLLYVYLTLKDDISGSLVTLGDKIIEEVYSAKFLGLTIDSNLKATYRQNM